MDGKALTGRMLLNLADEFTKAMNCGQIPVIKTSLEIVID